MGSALTGAPRDTLDSQQQKKVRVDLHNGKNGTGEGDRVRCRGTPGPTHMQTLS